MSGRWWLPPLLVLLAGASFGQQLHLVVISGLGGDSEHGDRFHQWSLRLLEAAAKSGVPAANVTYLAEDESRDPVRIAARSTRDNVLATLAAVSAKAVAEDQLWIVAIGHGSATGGEARLNLPGPDLTATDFAAALAEVEAAVVFVNTASASGGFLAPLSAGGRAVITATKSEGQRNATVFADYFSAALADGAADLDKNGRTSLLEAFDYARREVKQHYESRQLLLTENALLDDNGDGEGSLEPPLLQAAAAVDGELARRLYFGASPVASAPPPVAELLRERELLQRRLDELRRQKESLDEELYLRELEQLLVELALKDEAIRAFEAAAGASSEAEPAPPRVDSPEGGC